MGLKKSDAAKRKIAGLLRLQGIKENKIKFTGVSGPHPPSEFFTRRTQRKGNFYQVTVNLPNQRRGHYYVFENGDVKGAPLT